MEREWNEHGTKMEPKWNENGTRTERKWNEHESRTERTWNEDGTKMEQQSIENRSEIRCRSRLIFDAMFVDLWKESQSNFVPESIKK